MARVAASVPISIPHSVLILMSTAERFSSSLRLPLGQPEGHGPLECALRLGVLFVGLAPRGHAEQPGPAFLLPGRNAAVLVPVHPSGATSTSTCEALTLLLACRVSTASGKCISLRLPVGPGEARANNNDNNKRIQPWAGQARSFHLQWAPASSGRSPGPWGPLEARGAAPEPGVGWRARPCQYQASSRRRRLPSVLAHTRGLQAC